MGALKSKLWDDYVEKRVRETQRRELASAVILDYFGPQPPAAHDEADIEGVYVIERLVEEGLVLGLEDDEEAWVARVQVPLFLRRLLRANDTYFFRLRQEEDALVAVWIGAPWLH